MAKLELPGGRYRRRVYAPPTSVNPLSRLAIPDPTKAFEALAGFASAASKELSVSSEDKKKEKERLDRAKDKGTLHVMDSAYNWFREKILPNSLVKHSEDPDGFNLDLFVQENLNHVANLDEAAKSSLITPEAQELFKSVVRAREGEDGAGKGNVRRMLISVAGGAVGEKALKTFGRTIDTLRTVTNAEGNQVPRRDWGPATLTDLTAPAREEIGALRKVYEKYGASPLDLAVFDAQFNPMLSDALAKWGKAATASGPNVPFWLDLLGGSVTVTDPKNPDAPPRTISLPTSVSDESAKTILKLATGEDLTQKEIDDLRKDVEGEPRTLRTGFRQSLKDAGWPEDVVNAWLSFETDKMGKDLLAFLADEDLVSNNAGAAAVDNVMGGEPKVDIPGVVAVAEAMGLKGPAAALAARMGEIGDLTITYTTVLSTIRKAFKGEDFAEGEGESWAEIRRMLFYDKQSYTMSTALWESDMKTMWSGLETTRQEGDTDEDVLDKFVEGYFDSLQNFAMRNKGTLPRFTVDWLRSAVMNREDPRHRQALAILERGSPKDKWSIMQSPWELTKKDLETLRAEGISREPQLLWNNYATLGIEGLFPKDHGPGTAEGTVLNAIKVLRGMKNLQERGIDLPGILNRQDEVLFAHALRMSQESPSEARIRDANKKETFKAFLGSDHEDYPHTATGVAAFILEEHYVEVAKMIPEPVIRTIDWFWDFPPDWMPFAFDRQLDKKEVLSLFTADVVRDLGAAIDLLHFESPASIGNESEMTALVSGFVTRRRPALVNGTAHWMDTLDPGGTLSASGLRAATARTFITRFADADPNTLEHWYTDGEGSDLEAIKRDNVYGDNVYARAIIPYEKVTKESERTGASRYSKEPVHIPTVVKRVEGLTIPMEVGDWDQVLEKLTWEELNALTRVWDIDVNEDAWIASLHRTMWSGDAYMSSGATIQGSADDRLHYQRSADESSIRIGLKRARGGGFTEFAVGKPPEDGETVEPPKLGIPASELTPGYNTIEAHRHRRFGEEGTPSYNAVRKLMRWRAAKGGRIYRHGPPQTPERTKVRF